MHKIIKTSIISLSAISMAFGIAFISQYKAKPEDNSSNFIIDDDNYLETPQEKLINSLGSIKGFRCNAYMEFILDNASKIELDFSGDGDASDVTDIKLDGHMDFNVDGQHIDTNLAYFDSIIYFDFHNSYFKMATDSVLDFIEMLPNKGINLSIPDEIKNFDVDSLQSMMKEIGEPEETPDASYFFKLPLSDDMYVYITSDKEYNFTGIKTDLIAYETMLFDMHIELENLDVSELLLNNPYEDKERYIKYQEFSPFFNLFDGLYELTQKNQNTINANLLVKKENEDEGYDNYLGTDVDLTYNFDDKENALVALDGSLQVYRSKENEQGTKEITRSNVGYEFAYLDKAIYMGLNDVKVSLQIDSISYMLSYILDKIGEANIQDLLSAVVASMGDVDLVDTIQKADNALGAISLTSSSLGIGLSLQEMGLNVSDFDIVINFNEDSGSLETIEILDITSGKYKVDVTLTFEEYKPFSIIKENYGELEYPLGFVDVYEKYKDRNDYRIEFDANIQMDDEKKPMTLDGGIQFELDPNRHVKNEDGSTTNNGYGYGELTLVDSTDYVHNFKADMKSVEEILFTYNNTMNGKFKIQTMKDLVEVVMDVIQNPDDHFQELFGEMLDQTANLPIMDVINGDYLALFAFNLVNSLDITDNEILINLALDVVGMSDASFTVAIGFDTNTVDLTYLKIEDVELGEEYEDLSIEFNAYLKETNDSTNMVLSRLDQSETYIDFSDIKVLLELGINTSKNNYYHFTSTATVGASLFSLDLPIDIKIWTDHGDVKVSVDFTSVPLVVGVTKPLISVGTTYNKRESHLYYHDGYFYVNRIDNITTGILWNKKTKDAYTRAKYNTEYFMNNILSILLGTTLGLTDTIVNQVGELDTSSDAQIKYEKILENFQYSEKGHYFFFDIDIAELANNDQLKELQVYAYTDNSNTELTGLKVSLSIDVLITLKVQLDLTLKDKSTVADDSNRLTALESFESSYTGTLNKVVQINW